MPGTLATIGGEMSVPIKAFLALVLVIAISDRAAADAPYCHTHTSGGYCQYRGTVKQIYVNNGNRILLYFDTPLDLSQPANVGISGITRHTAASVVIDDNPEFAKFFYSSALAAQASGRRIIVQMRGNSSGYLKIDRIWVLE